MTHKLNTTVIIGPKHDITRNKQLGEIISLTGDKTTTKDKNINDGELIYRLRHINNVIVNQVLTNIVACVLLSWI